MPTDLSPYSSVVEYSNPEDAQRAIAELNDKTLMGRPLFIREVSTAATLKQALSADLAPFAFRIARMKPDSAMLLWAADAEVLSHEVAVEVVPLVVLLAVVPSVDLAQHLPNSSLSEECVATVS